MGLGLVKADVVEIAPVMSLRQSLRIMQRDPAPPLCFFFPREQNSTFADILRPGEFGRHDRADPDSRGKVIPPIAKLDVIARIGCVRAHQSFDGLALMADLPGCQRIGSDRLVHVAHVVKGLAGATRA
jgi:hypothetical protein